MRTNGHATPELFETQPAVSSDQQTLIVKISELQEAMQRTNEIGRQVMELASRVVLTSNLPEPQKKPHVIKIALTHFDNSHRKRFTDPDTGEPIPAKIEGGKDSSLMKKAIETYGLERVEQLIDQFFDLDDEWLARKTGYTVAAFSNRIPMLIASHSTPVKAHGLTRNTANNDRNMRVAADLIRNQYR
jgi:hypothetical protein